MDFQKGQQSSGKYGFYDRLTAAFPSQIIADLTEVCNLACVHCPHPEFKKSPHYTGSSLELDLHHKMVDEVATHGKGHTQYIRYTSNGEPLLNKNVFTMLEYAVSRSNTKVCLTSNGTLLDEGRAEKLLSTGIYLLDISIDAHSEESYAKIRVKGNLANVKKHLIQFLRLREKVSQRPRVVVSFIKQEGNQGEAEDFEKFWLDHGVDEVVLRNLHSASGAIGATADKLRSSGSSQERRACLYPWERIILSPSGHLQFCPSDWVRGSEFADYRNTTIKEAWQGKFYQELRSAHLCNNYGKHAFCGQCPDWQLTNWPGAGRSYADMVAEV